MSWNVWLVFLVTETALCLTPGPAVLFVVSHGLTRGGRASLAANAGILSGNALYFVLSAMGLSAVLLASSGVFTALTYAGAVYLVYLGIQTIRGAGLGLRHADGAQARESGWRTWTRAAALQLANPKALLFFAALLPQFIDQTRPIVRQMAILAVTSVAVEFVVLAGYGFLAAGAARLAREARFVRLTNAVSGSLLIAAAVGLAVSRSRG